MHPPAQIARQRNGARPGPYDHVLPIARQRLEQRCHIAQHTHLGASRSTLDLASELTRELGVLASSDPDHRHGQSRSFWRARSDEPEDLLSGLPYPFEREVRASGLHATNEPAVDPDQGHAHLRATDVDAGEAVGCGGM
jgi:hypothetical protein